MGSWKTHPLTRTFNRYLTAWQRNRPRRIRRRVLDFPPLASEPHARSLVVLCEADKFLDGCWCAWSWLRYVQPWLRLRLFVDGEVNAENRAAFTRLFPYGEIVSLPAYLATQPAPAPNFRALLDHYKYARKLAMILHLQRAGSFLYCDSDVLALRRPEALLERIERGSPDAFMVDQGHPCVDPWIRERARMLGLPCCDALNSGLLWIAENSLDATLVERLLEGWSPAVYNHFSEQTILAVLLPSAGAEPLPSAEYLLNARGMFFYERDVPCEEIDRKSVV